MNRQGAKDAKEKEDKIGVGNQFVSGHVRCAAMRLVTCGAAVPDRERTIDES
jgi:hypothetical protein